MRLRKELLVTALSLVLVVLATEGLLRVFPSLLPMALEFTFDDDPQTRGVAHPRVGNLHQPNSVHVVRTTEFEISYPTNAHGFNNPEPWPATAEIVVVGDSLTFGYGVDPDQAWPGLLARELSPASVVNLGLIGAGPQQYSRIYETFGVDLEPKVLLIGFFLANDFWDAELFERWQESGVGGNYMVWRDFGRQSGPNAANPIDALGDLLQNHSHLYNLARYVRRTIVNWRRGEPRKLSLAGGGKVALWPSNLDDKTAYIEPGNPIFELTVDGLERMHALATRRGTHVLVVLQPSKEETYLPFLSGHAVDPGAPLRAALDARGIPYLDLLPAYREHAEAGIQLFFEVDGHPNLEGYRLTAREVAAHLRHNAEAYGLSF